MGSFSLDPEDIKSWIWGPFWNFSKEQGSPKLLSDYGAQIQKLIDRSINQSIHNVNPQNLGTLDLYIPATNFTKQSKWLQHRPHFILARWGAKNCQA